ncbi:MAG: type II toxin-antitoxin system VapC family toxin [Candidatus Electrothrix sp. Rat3]|nr:type II toxin-antitoxin system VapC family toxin [Candidatus Electrothrix rattekaaiensis]
MPSVIFDTNIWIYLLEGRSALADLKAQVACGEVVPVLTPVIFAEVLGWQEIQAEQEREIRRYFASLNMLPLTMEHWEQIISWRKQGIKKKMPDLLIAAASYTSGLPVLTRNIKDFNGLSVKVENPWT